MNILPDGSAFFVAEIDASAPKPKAIFGQHPAVQWNPGNKVVQDHRDGTIHERLTNAARLIRGLRVPWKPEYGDEETRWADMI